MKESIYDIELGRTSNGDWVSFSELGRTSNGDWVSFSSNTAYSAVSTAKPAAAGDTIWIEKEPGSEEIVGPFKILENTNPKYLMIVGTQAKIPMWARVFTSTGEDCRRTIIFDHAAIPASIATVRLQKLADEATKAAQAARQAQDMVWGKRKEWWDTYGEDIIRGCLALGTTLCGGAALLGLLVLSG